jgi:uncharacterized protein YoxC
MQIKSFVALALFGSAFATPVLRRDLASIQGALGDIQKSITALDTDIKGITGTQDDAAKLATSADAVTKTLQTATDTVKKSEPLALNDAVGLQQTGNQLTTAVMTTITDLIAKKPQIQMVQGGQAQVVKTLTDAKAQGSQLADAIVSKVPAVAQNIAKQSIMQLTASFDMGIQAFQ